VFDNEGKGRGTNHHYCKPNRHHRSEMSVSMETGSALRIRTVGSTATIGAAFAFAAGARSSAGVGSTAVAGEAGPGTVGGSVDLSAMIALVAK
jgi:hypothetical protein